jgi:hypothetical protein
MLLLQVRSIHFNLKDASNPDLRRRVMTGEIDPQVRGRMIAHGRSPAVVRGTAARCCVVGKGQ